MKYLDLFLAACPGMLSHDLIECVDKYEVNVKEASHTCFQLWTCNEDILAGSFADSVAHALMCDKISAAVQLLTPCVQGIMGCCTDRAEGWWKTVAIALFSLDAGLSVLIRPAVAQWGSILLRWPKVLTQTFQVSVMMPQTCHSCHKTDMTFFWLMRRKKKKILISQDEARKVLFCPSNLPSFASACKTFYAVGSLFSQKSTKTTSCEFIGDSNDCDPGFNLSTKAKDLAIKTYEIKACWAPTERLNRCLEAIYERWLINGRKMKWEMKRCLLRLMKRELVGGRFVQLSIFNLNHLNTAYMKGESGNTVAYCGFLPLM